MRGPWLRPLALLVVCAAVIGGLILAGRWARLQLDARQHYEVALADIAVEPPPGLDHRRFLSEVQYLGNLPDRISGLDPALVLRLATAFAAHPWVESVLGVSLRGSAGPTARLRIRTPILAIGDRAVDIHGVLLPAGASIHGLIPFSGSAEGARGPAGAPSSDPNIVRAARLAHLLAPFQESLQLTGVRADADGHHFTGKVRVRWPADGDDQLRVRRLRERLAEQPAIDFIDLAQ